MKVIHIVNVNPGRFVLPFAQRMNQLGFENQTFLPIGTTEKQLAFCQEIENSCLIPYPQTYNPWHILKFLMSFSKEISSYDLIIWHSLFFQRVLLAFLLFFHPKTVKKSAWLVWGGDLYEWKTTSLVSNFIYRRFVDSLRLILASPVDVETLHDNFGKQLQIININVYQNFDGVESTLKDVMTRRKSETSPLRIMIGHSAVVEMNHKECLDVLAKFKTENILICLPLSYGISSYADEIESYAKNLFGEDKVLSLRTYLPLNSYCDFLGSIDVAVFNSKRQIAWGNILPLLYMGKSLFFSSGGVMYPYFIGQHLTVGCMEDLKRANSLSEIVFPASQENIEFAKQYYNVDSFKQTWDSIFHGLEESRE